MASPVSKFTVPTSKTAPGLRPNWLFVNVALLPLRVPLTSRTLLLTVMLPVPEIEAP